MILNKINLESVPEIEEVETGTAPRKKSSKLDQILSTNEFYTKYAEPDQVCENWDLAIESLQNEPEFLVSILEVDGSNIRVVDNSILSLIDAFGSREIPEFDKVSLLKQVRSLLEVDCVIFKGNYISIIKNDNTEIHSMILSKILKPENPDLETSARKYISPTTAIEVAHNLPMQTKIVTGRVAGITDKAKRLHTWVETSIEGEPMVVDYTLNSIMNKSGYYKLRDAEQISSVNTSDVLADMEDIAPLIQSGELSLTQYLIYRDKIVEALAECQQ